MSWFLAFLGFALLIILHEFGHFIAAKAVGMRVERFSLFFPPLLVRKRFKSSETEYAIGAIPLGGYVKITGMSPDEQIDPQFVDRAYYRQPVWKRIVVIFAGPLVNLILAILLLWGLLAFNPIFESTTKVDAATAGSPAAAVLKPGDRIVAVDGLRGDTDTLRNQISSHSCGRQATGNGCRAATAATISLVRNGSEREVKARPVYDRASGGMRLGFTFATEERQLGPFAAAGRSVEQTWSVTKLTVRAVVRLFYSSEARKQVSGVVGGYEITRRQIEDRRIVNTIWTLAVISLSLAIINLFPFLPLDGGHIFWALSEKLRGRPISVRVMERASAVGFVLVLMLFAIGLTNDISWLGRGAPMP